MPQAPDAPRTDRHARRRARTRAALVGAARELFAAQGAEATTIAEIAERADTAHGSFYNHFATKHEVLAAVLEEELDEQLALLDRRRAGVDDPAERVAIAHRQLLAAVRTDPEWGWLLLRLDLPLAIVETALGDDATSDLHEGIGAGRFAVADPAVAVHASGGALLAVMHVVLRDGLGAEADAAHAEGVLRSYGVPPAEAAEIARRPLPDAAAD